VFGAREFRTILSTLGGIVLKWRDPLGGTEPLGKMKSGLIHPRGFETGQAIRPAWGTGPYRMVQFYAADFCCARTLAHLALCAAAIFRRAAAERIRLTGALLAAVPDDFAPPRTFAHRALCACAIRLRAIADTTRFG
jgi:hypothetical protein